MECYVWTILVGVVLSFVTTEISAPAIFGAFYKPYKNLNRKSYLEWNARWLSTVHAIFICIMSLYALVVNRALWAQPFSYTDNFSEIAICISMGYMIYDLITMPMYMHGSALLSFVIHHTIVIWGSLKLLTTSCGKFYPLVKYLTELSTPVLNLRWCLRASGHPSNDPAVAVTTVIFMILFVLTRNIGSIPIWISVMINLKHSPPVEGMAIFTVLAIGLDILNLVWAYKVCSLGFVAIKHLRQNRLKNQTNGLTNQIK